jgi:hypothetical protein
MSVDPRLNHWKRYKTVLGGGFAFCVLTLFLLTRTQENAVPEEGFPDLLQTPYEAYRRPPDPWDPRTVVHGKPTSKFRGEPVVPRPNALVPTPKQITSKTTPSICPHGLNLKALVRPITFVG